MNLCRREGATRRSAGGGVGPAYVSLWWYTMIPLPTHRFGIARRASHRVHYLALPFVAAIILAAPRLQAQTSYFGGSGALSGPNWSTNPGGPFNQSFVSGNTAQ